MPFSLALMRHIGKAVAGSGLPGRNRRVPLRQRGAHGLAGSRGQGLFCVFGSGAGLGVDGGGGTCSCYRHY